MVYKWRDGGRYSVSAQVVGEELDRLRQEHGGNIEAADVVEAAKDEDSPLHNLFEWNNRTAAEEYRLYQARMLICSVMVIPAERSDVGPVRAFVNVREERRTFTSMERAMSSPDLRAQVVAAAKRELIGWRRRYAAYKELAGVFAAIDAMDTMTSNVG